MANLRNTRREREARMFGPEAAATLALLVRDIAQPDGLGVTGFARRHDVRYNVLAEWITADPARMLAVNEAQRMRAAINGDAVEAIGRKLVAPDVRTGHDWLDDGDAVLDPKAARVAVDAFRWSASVKDRATFGRVTQHNHTHTMQVEHLQALRARMSSSGQAKSLIGPAGSRAQVSALRDIVDADYHVITPQRIDLIAQAWRLPLAPCES